MPIILNAGYEGDIGAIFTGKVSQVSDKHSGTEVITTIAAAEALEEWLSKEVNKTYTAGSKASAIVKDLLNILGLRLERWSWRWIKNTRAARSARAR